MDENLIELPHAANKERDEALQAALEVAEAQMAALKKSLKPAQYTLILERTTFCQEREKSNKYVRPGSREPHFS